MTDFNQFHESLELEPLPAKRKLPDMLNVLTILSFIGCGFQLLSAIFNYMNICSSVRKIEELSELSESGPFGSIIGSSIKIAELQCEKKEIILIVSILFGALSLIGAIMMRKLKKAGFYSYVVGNLGLPIATVVLLSTAMGTFSYVTGFFFPVLFVVLYATQLKHMK